MRLYELLEALRNRNKVVDALVDNNVLAREITQTYNKAIKPNFKQDQKTFHLWWAQYYINDSKVKMNPDLVAMLNEIITICSNKD